MKGQWAYGKEVGQVAKNRGPETDEKSLGPIYGRGPERQAPMVTHSPTPAFAHLDEVSDFDWWALADLRSSSSY